MSISMPMILFGGLFIVGALIVAIGLMIGTRNRHVVSRNGGKFSYATMALLEGNANPPPKNSSPASLRSTFVLLFVVMIGMSQFIYTRVVDGRVHALKQSISVQYLLGATNWTPMAETSPALLKSSRLTFESPRGHGIVTDSFDIIGVTVPTGVAGLHSTTPPVDP